MLSHELLEDPLPPRPRVATLRLCFVEAVHNFEDLVVWGEMARRACQLVVEFGIVLVCVSRVAIPTRQSFFYVKVRVRRPLPAVHAVRVVGYGVRVCRSRPWAASGFAHVI